MTAAAAASLAYLSMRSYRAWAVAVIVNQLAAAACGLVAAQGATVLIATPARGCFAGLVNLAILLFLVATPAAVAVILLAAIGCLIVLRPRAEKSVSKWVKQLPVALVVLADEVYARLLARMKLFLLVATATYQLAFARASLQSESCHRHDRRQT